MSSYQLRQVGSKYSKDFKLYLEKDSKPISFFHDVPMRPNKGDDYVFNMVVEIPRFSNAKAEIATKSELNPIKYDVKKDKVRFVKNQFPYKGYLWNYGAIPQTWEDPEYINPDTKCKGDNDPVDVCEIGTRVASIGEIKQVKLIGTLAMLDEGETDWKMLCIDINDPKANLINDIEDVETQFPGLLNATLDWFKYYKVPDGKPKNKFAFNEKFLNKKYALSVINETHHHWSNLIKSKAPYDHLHTRNSTLHGTPHYKKDISDIPNQDVKPDHPISKDVDDWYFINKNSKL
ncbi:inorganic pyrophosphatase [Neoconidiobolus thromboides FSU 785]|nr:inorganic pyrophosphatase [Neoconidiobolus thromboides FSU 785]